MPPREKDGPAAKEPGANPVAKPEPLSDELSQRRLQRRILGGDSDAINEAKETRNLSALPAMLDLLFRDSELTDEIYEAFCHMTSENRGSPEVANLAPQIAKHFERHENAMSAFLFFSHLADLDPERYSGYVPCVLLALESHIRYMCEIPETSRHDSFGQKVYNLIDGLGPQDTIFVIVMCLGNLRCTSALPELRRLYVWAEDAELREAIEASIGKIEARDSARK